jgi:hypothetical protein
MLTPSRQTLEWIAEHSDGWISYPRSLQQQTELVARWRAVVADTAPDTFKPFAHSFYVDLTDDPDHPPEPIHLGIRGGRTVVFRFLDALRTAGVNHIILNLKYGRRDAGEVLEEIGRERRKAAAEPKKAAPPPAG